MTDSCARGGECERDRRRDEPEPEHAGTVPVSAAVIQSTTAEEPSRPRAQRRPPRTSPGGAGRQSPRRRRRRVGAGARARRLAARGDWRALAAKIANAPREDHPHYAQFVDEVRQLMAARAAGEGFQPGAAVQAAHAQLRQRIAFLHKDRALDGDVRAVCALLQQRAFADAAHPWLLVELPDYP